MDAVGVVEGEARPLIRVRGEKIDITVLVPAHNEEETIGETIESLLAQTRLPDRIVIIANGCTDLTVDVAKKYPVIVMDLPRLKHRKSEAMNRGWNLYGRDSDLVVSMDADTVLVPNAIEDWEKESWKRLFGGSTSKFTIRQPGLWCRLQKSEYAYNIQQGLNQGWTNVLAGAGSAFSGTALREIAARDDREGPWSYESAVEDYELTYRLREAGYKTYVSTTIRAYTDGMKNLKSLWGQRMKWQAGTLQDLLRFGVNRLTIRDWLSQMLNLLGPAIRALWVMVISLALYLDALTLAWWGLLVPLLFVAINLKTAVRVPYKDKWDILIVVFIVPIELLACIRGGWILASWGEIIRKKITRKDRDLWAAQYKAEGAARC